MAELSGAINLDEIAAGLLSRIHEVTAENVVQSAVVGRAADGNEEIVAFVQLLPGSRVTPEELMRFVRFQLTSYKRPSEIVLLDALPATSTGKILKHKLAESLRGETLRADGRLRRQQI